MGKPSRQESRRDRQERSARTGTVPLHPQVPPSLNKILTETFPAGVTASRWTALPRDDDPGWFIVAANVRGPGITGTDQAMWLTNRLSGTGRIYALNALAEQLTDLPRL